MGTRKLQVLLTDFLVEHQIKMGRDALFDLLARHSLLVRRRRRRIQTTQSGHWYKRYPNLIIDLQIIHTNQLWVSDITYIKTRQGFLYLSLITDACSRKIVGYNLANDLESVNALKALKMAIGNAQEQGVSLQGLIHHSDQGFQYCSSGYVDLLKKHTISISMSDRGRPLQNAVAERVNGIIKYEYLMSFGPKHNHQVRAILPTIIETYNSQRPHLSCSMLTPSQAHLVGKPLGRCWKSYYQSKERIPVNVLQD
jgi:transposase InsO family protein